MAWSLEQLEAKYPAVQWREPVAMSLFETSQEKHYACRICIANAGIKAQEVPRLPLDPEHIATHIREAHMSQTIDERRKDHLGNPTKERRAL